MTIHRIQEEPGSVEDGARAGMLDVTLRKLEQGKINSLEALDDLLVEELTLRESRRVKAALMWARLTAIKTLAGFDFTFQPSLDKGRILALAELKFIDRAEVIYLLGPPGTGKSHLATALAVEAVKAGRSVYFSTLSPTSSLPSPNVTFAHPVRTAKLRWRIERDYLELKQEIGLGEGRGWRGFHHHATLCIAAYAFLVAERVAFSPSKARCGTIIEMPGLPEDYRPRGAAGPYRAPRTGLDCDSTT